MAAVSGAVWAIDIGNNSLKALHLSAETGVIEVIGFDNIQHGRILTGDGVKATERDELVAISFRQFASQHDLGKDDVVVSVPSQNSFARFVNLPPVEQKRIPEIVKFEAVQQIPFDINDVQWDWQLMTETGSPENKVGIFAIKNEVVTSVLEHFGRENLQVAYVQMAPMALYNYILYDRPDLFHFDDQGIVVLNIGAENTDLVVCTKSTVWQRCILIGGNAFTRAIADTFKLSFEKAEKLKRTAPMSKYARQIFQAMRPVFTDIASEVQRSLGFYKSSNPNTKLTRIIALGGGTKMRGLLKYLQQTVQIPAERPDSFKNLAVGSGVSAVKFQENVCDFGVVYGLGLQGLGQARIESNLLPRGIARSMAWAGKARYFTAAACVLLLVSVLSFARTLFDRVAYGSKADVRQKISSIISTATEARSKLEAKKLEGSVYEAMIQKELEVFNYRDVIPLLHQTIISALPNEKNNPAQKKLYEAFANGDVETVREVPRKERKQIFITGMSVNFAEDVNTMPFLDTGLLLDMGKAGPGQYGADYERRRHRQDYTRSRSWQGSRTAQQVAVKRVPGFLVTIVGYSPYDYRRIGELMDPAGVENDKSRWGFITRLMHLDDLEVFDGNSPFELFKKTDVKHFDLVPNVVEISQRDTDSTNVPVGIGVPDIRFEKTRRTSTVELGPEEQGVRVLIDPMTKEIISKVPVLDADGKMRLDGTGKPIYQINDTWFILNAKFAWKDAPSPPEIAAPPMPGYYTPPSSTSVVPTRVTETEEEDLDGLGQLRRKRIGDL